MPDDSIIGPNGAGKSTLFNTIAGEYKPSAGSIHMLGEDVTRRSIQWRAHEGLARTFQTSRLFNGMSVGDNQQRQLEMAMALGGKTRLLMLDEPAAGLSPSERRSLTSLLRELDDDITLLLIEHDMDIALRVGERIVVMADGRKVLEGTPDEVRSSSMVREIYLGGDLHAK